MSTNDTFLYSLRQYNSAIYKTVRGIDTNAMHIQDVRRRNLRRYIDEHFAGVISHFADRADKSPTAISSMLSEDKETQRAFGEKIARQIESACGMARGALDQDDGSDAIAEPFTSEWSFPAQQLATLFDHLPHHERKTVWPWLVHMLARGSEGLLKTFIQYPARDAQVRRAFGTAGERRRKKPGPPAIQKR